MTTYLLILPLWLVVVSVLVAMLYGWDKWRAGRHGWRVSERVLHVGELLGGWPGALLAGYLFRHKTEKRSFRLIRAGCIAVNVLLIAGLIVLFFNTD